MNNPNATPEAVNIYPARLIYQPVVGFIEQVAAKSPAPGGGSVAALSGALGSALLSMVINFTVDKKNYAAVALRLSELRISIENARAALTQLIDKDTDAFNRFRMANKLPARDETERLVKEQELAAATQATLDVPLETMTHCANVLEFAAEVVRDGNVNTVSDAATGAELLLAGLEGASANVLINLSGISGEQRANYLNQVTFARSRGRAVLAEVRLIVAEKLSV